MVNGMIDPVCGREEIDDAEGKSRRQGLSSFRPVEGDEKGNERNPGQGVKIDLREGQKKEKARQECRPEGPKKIGYIYIYFIQTTMRIAGSAPRADRFLSARPFGERPLHDFIPCIIHRVVI